MEGVRKGDEEGEEGMTTSCHILYCIHCAITSHCIGYAV